MVVFTLNIKDNEKIEILNLINGTQIGQVFGYSLVADDFNGDNLTDLAVGAPLYSLDQKHEHGAVYIYKNDGTEFISESIIKCADGGRFGTTMNKIGDVNQDGYNGVYNFAFNANLNYLRLFLLKRFSNSSPF